MFEKFKKKLTEMVGTESVGSRVPEPLAGREGSVGGIESIVLDGVTYYFGFDYRMDLVVSPLIADINIMARFASQYMEQLDGLHDVPYWLEVAGYDSQLCSNVQSRTFTTRELVATMASLRDAQERNAAVPDLAVKYHLRYLLASVGGWAEDEDLFDAADENIAYLRGEEPLPAGTSFAEIAQDLQAHLRDLMDSVPENWSTLFAILKS